MWERKRSSRQAQRAVAAKAFFVSDEDYSGLYRDFPGQPSARADARVPGDRLLAGTFEEFAGDLRATLAVWRRSPWLPIISAFVGGGSVPASMDGVGPSSAPAADPASALGPLSALAPPLVAVVFVAILALALFSLGWSGSERLVYARSWGGDPISPGEAARAAWGYVGRFLRLGLVIFIPFAIASLVLSLVAGDVVGPSLVIFVLFVVLTFAGPALVYDEDRATAALRFGWRLLRRQGRRAVWYAVVPPLVLAVLYRVAALENPVGWATYTVNGVVALAFKGAIASAYLRITASEPAPTTVGIP